MAKQDHLDILKQGVETWNQWRKDYPDIQPNLTEVDFRQADLSGADLSGANLWGARFSGARTRRAHLSKAPLRKVNRKWTSLTRTNLSNSSLRGARLRGVDLSEANLRGADLWGADLSETDLSGADLSEADMSEADLRDANMSNANLSNAVLIGANLIRSNLSNATLTNCLIYGVSVWDVKLEEAIQNDLIITPYNEPTITVDNLKVAQFIYLLLNNPEIRDVIDTITSKVVLILGRFTPERKTILDALREELRLHDFTPVLFDFEKPANRDITETVSTLAHLARFVIADITDAKSIPQELMTIVPNLPSVAVQPLILNSQHEYGMFEHFTRYPWVLPIYRYTDEASLLQSLEEKIIVPAKKKAKELERP